MKNYLVILTVIILFSGCTKNELEERKDRIMEIENNATETAINRKNRSIEILKSHNVPYIEHLPPIQDETQTTVRTQEEVAYRAICLAVVAVKGEGLEQERIEEIITEYEIENYLTPDEKEFVYNPSPSQTDLIQFTWRYECYWVLLWALGYIEQLDYPDTICDVTKAVEILVSRGRDDFIKDSVLRSESEILDQADLIYRYNWAVVNARLNNEESPSNLNPDVILERHYVLNWLINYMDQEWDFVTTDT
jgi:hypothetical protein